MDESASPLFPPPEPYPVPAEPLLPDEEPWESVPGEVAADEAGATWGFWASLGWTVLCVLVMVAVSLVCGIVIGFAVGLTAAIQGADFDAMFATYEGLLIIVAGCLGTIAVLAFLMVPMRLRRRSFIEYMALRGFSARHGLIAILAIAALLAAEMVTSFVLDRPIPESMIELRRGALFLPLLWLFVTVAAPVGEEILFRGFLYRGIAESRAGVAVAVVLTSLLWTGIHVQYGVYELSWIFVMGLLLGVVRHRSGSTALCILLHFLFNVVAMVSLEIMWSEL